MRSRHIGPLLPLAALLVFGGDASAYDPLVGNRDERELLKAVRGEKLIRAREQAERILRRRPDSFIARYALARALHDEEGNLPRALYHTRRLERWLRRRYGQRPRGEEARTWHRKLLEDEEALLGELDRREGQLDAIDRHDALYRPKLDYRRIWALMKLHRFDEAMRIAKRVAASKHLHRRISGLNGMIAIEMERLRPQACYRIGKRGVEATGERSCILLHNTAEAAFAVFKFNEIERLALKALQAPIKDCPNSSYPHLASLYLLRGDFQRAMEAVKSARAQGIRRRYRQQFEMENTGWLFRLLYALGKFDKAYELGHRLLRQPDRVGMTSTSRELRLLVAAVEYHAALAARLEAERERASARPLTKRAAAWLSRQRLRYSAWSARRRAARLMTGEAKLRNLVRPYFTPLTPWNAGAVIPVAGEGVTLTALRAARGAEKMKQAHPYFDGLEAEVAFHAGEPAVTLRLARKALGRLPKDEALLRGRVAALAADAARQLGRSREAAGLYHQVLNRFPTALRILGVPLPAQVRSDASPFSRRVAKVLLRSPRLTSGSAFAVRVLTRGNVTRVCLTARSGRRYACAEVDLARQIKQKVPEDDRVALVADAFHDKVFAPKVDLTQRDINSLDGSAVRGDADQLLEKVLGE
jgi:hypothetical protein